MYPCAATSARSRTTRSPAFERGGSAKNAHAQLRRLPPHRVVAAAPLRLSSRFRRQRWKQRRMHRLLAVAVASSRHRLQWSTLPLHRLLPRSRHFRARGSWTRVRRRKRLPNLRRPRFCLMSRRQPALSPLKQRPRLRRRPRLQEPHSRHRLSLRLNSKLSSSQ